jgi:hypothetical protein
MRKIDDLMGPAAKNTILILIYNTYLLLAKYNINQVITSNYTISLKARAK